MDKDTNKSTYNQLFQAIYNEKFFSMSNLVLELSKGDTSISSGI